jgi:hypothetical protein
VKPLLTTLAYLGLGCALILSAQQQTGAPAGIAVPAPPPVPAKPAQSGDAAGTPRVFRIRAVNGRNGAPLNNAQIHMWYDEPAGPGYFVSTDTGGYADMPQPVGTPIRILVTTANFTDCRKPDPGAPPAGYNLAAIARTGLATDNTCGDSAIDARPGELVFYMRPARWYDNVNRNQR